MTHKNEDSAVPTGLGSSVKVVGFRVGTLGTSLPVSGTLGGTVGPVLWRGLVPTPVTFQALHRDDRRVQVSGFLRDTGVESPTNGSPGSRGRPEEGL